MRISKIQEMEEGDSEERVLDLSTFFFSEETGGEGRGGSVTFSIIKSH